MKETNHAHIAVIKDLYERAKKGDLQLEACRDVFQDHNMTGTAEVCAQQIKNPVLGLEILQDIITITLNHVLFGVELHNIIQEGRQSAVVV